LGFSIDSAYGPKHSVALLRYSDDILHQFTTLTTVIIFRRKRRYSILNWQR